MVPLLATALGTGLIVGLIARGRLEGLATLRLRWTPVLLVALVVSLIPLVWDMSGTALPRTLLIVSNLGVLAFLVANVVWTSGGVRGGILIVAAGWALNFIAIASNGGMPLSKWAFAQSGQPGEIVAAKGGFFKVVVAGPGTTFRFLGDVIPVRAFTQVISIGDILLMVGIAVVIVAGMRLRAPSRIAALGDG